MSSTLILRPPLSLARRWPLIVLAVLLPLWCIGTLYRGSWTPDEPREADIVWRMANQDNRALPNFAGAPFLEKPPLSYWIAAEANSLFGDSIRASRVPNIVYTAITVFAIGALAFAMAGAEAALLASLLAGSTLLLLRVSIWLAPDACLMAGCAVALLGAYLGYVAKPGRAKLGAYTLMHGAAAIAFMAKSAPGWIVPALALLTLIAWERRWSELRRPELYAGLLLQALIIAPWIVSVWREPHGPHALRVLFLDNLAGRFSTMTSANGTAYSAGHRNWAGRYLLELPLSLLPWTFLIVAALRSAWTKFRSGTLSTAWRFALAASVPFIVLLSIASTARDIYAAPAVPGLTLLVSLWVLELDTTRNALGRFAFKATRTVVLVIAGAMTLAAALIAAANGGDFVDVLVLPALIALLTILCLVKAGQLDANGEHVGSLATTTAGFAIAMVLGSVAIFPAIDRWQDLPALGRAIHRDHAGKPLALLQPDETTLAMLDDSPRTPPFSLRAKPGVASDAVSRWFCEHPTDGRLLVMLPGHAPGEVSRFLGRWWREKQPGDGDAASLERDGMAKLLLRYELPHGRRYAVMGPASPACDHEALAIERP
ncbi:MAG: glycosyltransferase family 39 protein [Gammaproteobacteria bacterium]